MSRPDQFTKPNQDKACDEAKTKTVKEVAELKSLAFQVGGHGRQKDDPNSRTSLGICDLENGIVLKPVQPPPRGLRELNFYKEVFNPKCVDEDLLELQQFLPTFYGTEEIGDKLFLKLSNLTADFKKPCVADLKMGRITYDQEATEQKKNIEETKYPPAKELGFQFTGILVHESDNPVQYNKSFCRSLTKENIVSEGFGSFFSCIQAHQQREAIQNLISKLKRIESWFLKQKKYSFIASSLLIVYEGLNAISSKKDDVFIAQNFSENTNSPSANDYLSGTVSIVPHKDLLSSMQEENSLPELHINRPSNAKRSHDNEDLNLKRRKRRKSDIVDNEDSKLHHSNKAVNSSFQVCDAVPVITVHLIDFAHTFPANDKDSNVLFGVQKLISSLQLFIDGK